MESSINLTAVIITDLISVLLTFLMLTSKAWRSTLSQKEEKYMRLMIFAIMFSSIMDFCTFYFDGKAGGLQTFILYFSNYWMYLSYIIIGTLWIMVVVSHVLGGHIDKSQVIFISLISAVGIIILIVNAFTGIVFTIGDDNVYQRGELYLMYTIIEVLLALDGIVIYLYNRRKNPNSRHFPIAPFIIPAIIGALIQFFFYGVSTIISFFAISMCGVIFGLHNESEAEAEAVKERQKALEIIAEQKVQLEEQQAKLEETAKLATAASQAKTTFLNSMSHDIRTPMNAIIGYTNLASTNLDNIEQVKEYLSKIDTSSQHLLALINDVLDMSRIESGKVHLDEKENNVVSLVNNLASIVQSDVDKKELTLDVNINVKNENVILDKLHLNQVLLNILSNSIKYTPNGGNIIFSVEEKPIDEIKSEYAFIVKDNGMGMSQEFLKTIFDPFTRVQSSTMSGIQGTGLGMSITKSIIDMMNGTIVINSEEGKGTEEIITFEFNITDKVVEEIVEKITYDFTGKKILLVEDNEMNREIAVTILEADGFIVDSVEDGSYAVEKMKTVSKDTYDLILMDVQMPIMNGYEATQQIRKIESEVSSIPIIAMTANAFEEDKNEAIESGMNDYIAKPIDVELMKKVIAKYLF